MLLMEKHGKPRNTVNRSQVTGGLVTWGPVTGGPVTGGLITGGPVTGGPVTVRGLVTWGFTVVRLMYVKVKSSIEGNFNVDSMCSEMSK